MAPKGMYRIQPTGLCKPCDPTIYADGPVDYIQPALTMRNPFIVKLWISHLQKMWQLW